MFTTEEKMRHESILSVAGQMMTAARTAPKACGFDNLEIGLADKETIDQLANHMREIAQRPKCAFFERDAENIGHAEAIILIGTRNNVQGLDCGLCGYDSCALKNEKSPTTPCIFNTHDLGLAIGSAVSIAADCRVDNRIMYSVGVAARELGLMPNCPIIMSIPITARGKSPFFDRKIASCAK